MFAPPFAPSAAARADTTREGPMDAGLRAIADRVVFDSAVILHIASGIREDQSDLAVSIGGRTVRQVLGHLCSSLESHAAAIQRILAEDRLAPGSDPAASNASPSEADRGPDIAESAGRIRRARSAFLEGITAIDLEAAASPAEFGRRREILGTWARHFAEHGLDLILAMRQFQGDPIALNWILAVDFRDNPGLRERQRRLLAIVETRASAPRAT